MAGSEKAIARCSASGMLRKISSYLIAATLGLIAVAPPIPYEIPMMINSFRWLYLVVATGLFGFFMLHLRFHILLKVLVVYLFATCFLSQVPWVSFNAFIVIVATLFFFLLCQYSDYDPILKMVETVFWYQCIIAGLQYFDLDTLMSFDQPRRFAFFGTIFQQMRLSSLFAIMTPLLLARNRLYIIPLFVSAAMLNSMGFSLALCVGVFTYLMFRFPKYRFRICVLVAAAVILFAIRDWASIHVSIVEGRLPVWWVILKSWALDTTGPIGKPDLFGIAQTGPFDPQRFFFGHGLDTFLPLFPLYKHDANPFPQAHNDWLQIGWELGLVGLVIFSAWSGSLLYRLHRRRMFLEFAGLMVMAVNMFFHFPQRMTQTIWLMVAFAAYCEQRIREYDEKWRSFQAFRT